jgi:uncharacterized protein YwlG (UPF0340 family)
MKESYGEGLANHTSLESCGNCSNVMAEALTEGSIGGLLSSEITSSRVPTTWSDGEGNTLYSVIMRAVERPGRVLELGMCGHLLHGNREIHGFFSNRKVRRNGQ